MYRKLTTAVAIGLFAGSAMAQVELFTNQAAFQAFNLSQGNSLEGIDDFSESNVTTIAALTSPLLPGVPNIDPANGQGFPTGLAQANLTIRSWDPVGGVPAGFLVALGADLLGPGLPPSVMVGPDNFNLSTDLLFGPGGGHTGIAFEIIDLSGAGNGLADILVYDENDVLITTVLDWAFPPDRTAFFGIWSSQSIGKINVAGQPGAGGTPGGELLRNIEMWVPEPGSLSLLALGVFAAMRRRW